MIKPIFRFHGLGVYFDCFSWDWGFAWVLWIQTLLCVAFYGPGDTQEYLSGTKNVYKIEKQ